LPGGLFERNTLTLFKDLHIKALGFEPTFKADFNLPYKGNLATY
jgi:hypothetical protein